MEVKLDYELLKNICTELEQSEAEGDYALGFKEGRLNIIKGLIKKCDAIKESEVLAKEVEEQEQRVRTNSLREIAWLTKLFL